jgi:hypothetical protein
MERGAFLCWKGQSGQTVSAAAATERSPPKDSIENRLIPEL